MTAGPERRLIGWPHGFMTLDPGERAALGEHSKPNIERYLPARNWRHQREPGQRAFILQEGWACC